MKRILFVLAAALLLAACKNSSGNQTASGPWGAESAPDTSAPAAASESPVARYIAMASEYFLLRIRLDAEYLSDAQEEELERQQEDLEDRMERFMDRNASYRLTEADRQLLMDWLENELPKYGRTAHDKDYRLVRNAVTLGELE